MWTDSTGEVVLGELDGWLARGMVAEVPRVAADDVHVVSGLASVAAESGGTPWAGTDDGPISHANAVAAWNHRANHLWDRWRRLGCVSVMQATWEGGGGHMQGCVPEGVLWRCRRSSCLSENSTCHRFCKL